MMELEKAMEQQRQWEAAQKIKFSIDLVAGAKKLLKFVAAVDRNRYLYEDSVLQRAIYRYYAFWLPLLAKHTESPVSKEPLVVPFDCEWIWHIHRLNPVMYNLDCEKLHGRVLGSKNVISTLEMTSKSESEEIWKNLYPGESFELDLSKPFSEDMLKKSPDVKVGDYDLVAAVKRQIPFAYQISRPHTFDDIFLQEGLARYKGFLHIIYLCGIRGEKVLCVPTYDIDLMWHAHLRDPEAYIEDFKKILNRIVQHNDTINDRRKGTTLDIGATATTKQWEDTFGLRYWKAGAMHFGPEPTPVTKVPIKFNVEGMDFKISKRLARPIKFPMVQATEVFLEFAEVKNMAEEYKGNLSVSFSKKQPDRLFKTKRLLTIFSDSGKKQCGSVYCEPTGEFLFELMFNPPSTETTESSSEMIGSCSFSLEEIVASPSKRMADKWLSVDLVPGIKSYKQVLLHAYVSFAPTTPAPLAFQLVKSDQALDAMTLIQTRVVDCDGNDVFTLKMRNVAIDVTIKEVYYYTTDAGENQVVARFQGNSWYVIGNEGSLKVQVNTRDDEHLLELVGYKMVRLFSGRRLDFSPRRCEQHRLDQDFLTVVEFSEDYPYGKAIALIDLHDQLIKAKDEWIALPGTVLTFILSDILQGEERNKCTIGNNDKENVTGNEDGNVTFRTERCMADCGNCLAGGVEFKFAPKKCTSGNNDKEKVEGNEDGNVTFRTARCMSDCGYCLATEGVEFKADESPNQLIDQYGNSNDKIKGSCMTEVGASIVA